MEVLIHISRCLRNITINCRCGSSGWCRAEFPCDNIAIDMTSIDARQQCERLLQ
jgi:hypothetical protein